MKFGIFHKRFGGFDKDITSNWTEFSISEKIRCEGFLVSHNTSWIRGGIYALA